MRGPFADERRALRVDLQTVGESYVAGGPPKSGPTLGAEKPVVGEKEQYRAPEPVDIVVAPQSPGPYSPSQTGSYGRKWARKVD